MQPKTAGDYVCLSVRTMVGLWFLLIGADKVFRVGGPAFSRQVAAFEILKDPWNLPIAYLVPWIEIVAGFCLMSGWLARGAVRTLIGLTLVFVFVSAQAWAFGLPPDCGCFGKWFVPTHAEKMALLAVQLGLLVTVLVTERRGARRVFGGSQLRLPS